MGHAHFVIKQEFQTRRDNCVATHIQYDTGSELTCVQALCYGGSINEVTSTQLACDMLIDVTHSHRVLT